VVLEILWYQTERKGEEVMGLRYTLIVYPPSELRTFDADGNLLKQLAVVGWSYSGCAVTMDSQGNVYTDEGGDTLKKYDSNLNVLVTKDIESGNNWFVSLILGLDGYLYTLEIRASGYAIAKRNTTDLTIIEDVMTLGGSYAGGMCLDSNDNFYIYNTSTKKIEKRSSAGVLLASLYVGNILENAGFGICGSNLYISEGADKIYYMPLDLSGYTEWSFPSPTDPAYCLTAADNHLIVSGWGTGGVGATRKYDSDRNLIWEQFLGGSTYAYKAGAFIISIVIPTVTTEEITNILPNKANGGGEITDTGGEDCTKRGVCWNTTGSPTVADNIVEEEGTFGAEAFTSILTGLTPVTTIYVKAYGYNSAGYGYGAEVSFTTLEDFPLYPIIFPCESKGKDLKKNCINFETSMSDICITLNHNSNVVREYLQAAYGGTDYDESSNLQEVMPSMQLVKLSNKPEDLTAIINNFISNISDMFTTINQNNTIIKQWLDDYEPDEEAHEFTDVTLRPIVVGKDLNKAIDDLFEGVEDNVLILNNNIEVMKERF